MHDFLLPSLGFELQAKKSETGYCACKKQNGYKRGRTLTTKAVETVRKTKRWRTSQASRAFVYTHTPLNSKHKDTKWRNLKINRHRGCSLVLRDVVVLLPCAVVEAVAEVVVLLCIGIPLLTIKKAYGTKSNDYSCFDSKEDYLKVMANLA